MLLRPGHSHAAGNDHRAPRALARVLALALAALAAPVARAGTVITDEDVARFDRTDAASAAATQVATGPTSPAPVAPACGLLAPGSEQATTEACTACHPRSRTHPVDLDYARAAAAAPQHYVPAAEVVRAGGYLPDGQLRCVTCHDRASPWRYRIALPPGAVAAPSIATMRANPAEYPELRARAARPLPPGSDVTPTPLCRLCHRK